MMNRLGIGNDMAKILLPQVRLSGPQPDLTKPIDNQQMNPSCVFKYLGISGMGNAPGGGGIATRDFNMVPWLGLWEIYKNYYANKQEEIGAVIHTNPQPTNPTITQATIFNATPGGNVPVAGAAAVYTNQVMNKGTYMVFTFTAGQLTADFQINQIFNWFIWRTSRSTKRIPKLDNKPKPERCNRRKSKLRRRKLAGRNRRFNNYR